jgi:carbamoylphosphate synthase small subunit
VKSSRFALLLLLAACLAAPFASAATTARATPPKSTMDSQVDRLMALFNVRVTHRSLFDGSNQGIALTDAPAYSFQGHPEASPGPHDVSNLFDRFVASMEKH